MFQTKNKNGWFFLCDHNRISFKSAYSSLESKERWGVTEFVFEINWIKCKFSPNLIRHYCHSNRRSTQSVHSAWCLDCYSMHNFSFVPSEMSIGWFFCWNLQFFTFQETVWSHLNTSLKQWNIYFGIVQRVAASA